MDLAKQTVAFCTLRHVVFVRNVAVYFSCHNGYNENMFFGSHSAHVSAELYNYRAKYL